MAVRVCRAGARTDAFDVELAVEERRELAQRVVHEFDEALGLARAVLLQDRADRVARAEVVCGTVRYIAIRYNAGATCRRAERRSSNVLCSRCCGVRWGALRSGVGAHTLMAGQLDPRIVFVLAVLEERRQEEHVAHFSPAPQLFTRIEYSTAQDSTGKTVLYTYPLTLREVQYRM